jgi:hypothetical protein
MADATFHGEAVVVQCLCGKALEIEPQRLGKTTQCPSCKRYLRPALQFLLVDRGEAHNLTAQCACGHFIVEDPSKAGKRARCKICRSHLIMPQPVVKFTTETIVRVPRKALQNRMKRVQVGRQRAPLEMPRLQSAAHTGRVTLRPGEHMRHQPADRRGLRRPRPRPRSHRQLDAALTPSAGRAWPRPS